MASKRAFASSTWRKVLQGALVCALSGFALPALANTGNISLAAFFGDTGSPAGATAPHNIPSTGPAAGTVGNLTQGPAPNVSTYAQVLSGGSTYLRWQGVTGGSATTCPNYAYFDFTVNPSYVNGAVFSQMTYNQAPTSVGGTTNARLHLEIFSGGVATQVTSDITPTGTATGQTSLANAAAAGLILQPGTTYQMRLCVYGSSTVALDNPNFFLQARQSVTLRKTWQNANVNDTATINMTGVTGSLASTANTANETDSSARILVNTGNALTFSETLGAANTGSYIRSFACTGAAATPGGTDPGNRTLTVGTNDVDIICTYTNAPTPVAPAPLTCPAGHTLYTAGAGLAATNTTQPLSATADQTLTFGTSGVTLRVQAVFATTPAAPTIGAISSDGQAMIIAQNAAAARDTLLHTLNMTPNIETSAFRVLVEDVDSSATGGNNFRDAVQAVTPNPTFYYTTANHTVSGNRIFRTAADAPCANTVNNCNLSVGWNSAAAANASKSLAYYALHDAGTSTNQGVGYDTIQFCVPPQPTANIAVAKSFAPSSTPVNASSLLTLTLTNNTGAAVTLTNDFIDDMNLGGGLRIVSISDTCPGTATIVGTGLTANQIRYPAGATLNTGSCTISAEVVGDTPGTYTNTVPANDLKTTGGTNANGASAALTFTPARGTAPAALVCPANSTLLRLATGAANSSTTLPLTWSPEGTGAPQPRVYTIGASTPNALQVSLNYSMVNGSSDGTYPKIDGNSTADQASFEWDITATPAGPPGVARGGRGARMQVTLDRPVLKARFLATDIDRAVLVGSENYIDQVEAVGATSATPWNPSHVVVENEAGSIYATSIAAGNFENCSGSFGVYSTVCNATFDYATTTSGFDIYFNSRHSSGSSQIHAVTIDQFEFCIENLTISGQVLLDLDGATNGANGTGLQVSGLFAVLVDAAGNVVASTPVSATDGTYSLSNVANGTYTVRIATSAGTVGAAAPAAALPAGYAFVSESGGNAAANTVTTDGSIPVVVNNASVTDLRTGVQEQANLSITKDNGTTTVASGGTTKYVITVTNNGTTNIGAGSLLKDAPGTGLSLTAGSVSCTSLAGNVCPSAPLPTVQNLLDGYALPALPAGAKYQIEVSAQVTAGQ